MAWKIWNKTRSIKIKSKKNNNNIEKKDNQFEIKRKKSINRLVKAVSNINIKSEQLNIKKGSIFFTKKK